MNGLENAIGGAVATLLLWVSLLLLFGGSQTARGRATTRKIFWFAIVPLLIIGVIVA